MRVPISWLRKYCDSGLDAQALAERLAMTGTEVERVEHHGVSALEYFVVGKVREHRRHPDADRLSVCMVDIGSGELSQIVCGAPNVAAGQTVAVAQPGAIMPDGTRLRKAKLRGLHSHGMILAEDEVGIGTDHNGIMVLADKHEAGTPLASVLPISTDVLVLEITPNRPDCLGIYGVAREVHAATGAPLAPPPWADDLGMDGPLAGIEITVEDPELCPRFTARIFEFVTIAPSPLWMKARLMAAGQRPISNVVDVTNYVMLLTGQPMHAFDLDRIAGARLNVRHARPSEQVQTLDGQTRTLDEQMLVIEDGAGPTSIAGVMGGARSEVHDRTTRVLTEVASWNGANIHRTSLALGLRSEASGRFEKHLAPEQAMQAQALATRLMIELCGARMRGGTVDVGGAGPRADHDPPARRPPDRAPRDHDQPHALPADPRVARVHRRAGPRRPRRHGPRVPPGRRHARGRSDRGGRSPRRSAADPGDAAGHTQIRGRRPGGRRRPRSRRRPGTAHAAPARAPPRRRRARRAGAARGRRLELRRRAGRRASAARQRRRGQPREPDVGGAVAAAHDAARLAARRRAAQPLPRRGSPAPVRVRRRLPAHRRGRSAPRAASRRGPAQRTGATADLALGRAAVGGLLRRQGRPRARCSTRSPSPGRCVPASGRSCTRGAPRTILVGGVSAGWLGELHPSVAARWDIEQTVAAFELDLDVLGEGAAHLYVDVTSFPAVREDLAVIVGERVSAAEVLAVVARRRRAAARARRGVRRLPRRREARRRQRVAGARALLPGAGPHAHRRRGRPAA